MPLRHFATSALLSALIACQLVRSSAAEEAFNQRLAEAGRALALTDSRVQSLDETQRSRLASFAIGNIVFVLFHEMGHAVVSELKLPVLGRQEDAADTFATLAMLYIGTEVSNQVLEDAARGLYLLAERAKETKNTRPMYDEHGLDLQRAYQIVCLMVGSDQRTFKDIATRAKLPQERQESCQVDFDDARESWSSLLKSHAPSGSEAKTSFVDRLLRWRGSDRDGQSKVKVDYQAAVDRLAHYRSALMAAGVLEFVSDLANKNLSLPRPITLKAKMCNEENAFWDDRERELILCYELVSEFVDLGLRLPPR